MSAIKNLQANLRRIRAAQGITQQAFAEKLGLEYKYYQRIESGRWPGLQLRTVEKIGEVLDLEAWQLLAPSKRS